MAADLNSFWVRQKAFNTLVKTVQPEISDWAVVYLLGMVAEVDSVLSEIGWKRLHRVDKINRKNLSLELADLTKYVVSLWQEFGFTSEEMLQVLESKSTQLEEKIQSEFLPPSGKRVIVTDLDGTGADFREGFAKWCDFTDNTQSLAMDVDNGLRFHEFEQAKAQFESMGGYAELPIYEDWGNLIRKEKEQGTFVMVITARPGSQFRNIWQDTKNWLSKHEIQADAVLFGRDERIFTLLRLSQANEVLLLEDDPVLAMRAAGEGIPVFLRTQPYNIKIQHPLISRMDKFPEKVDWESLPQKNQLEKGERKNG